MSVLVFLKNIHGSILGDAPSITYSQKLRKDYIDRSGKNIYGKMIK